MGNNKRLTVILKKRYDCSGDLCGLSEKGGSLPKRLISEIIFLISLLSFLNTFKKLSLVDAISADLSSKYGSTRFVQVDLFQLLWDFTGPNPDFPVIPHTLHLWTQASLAKAPWSWDVPPSRTVRSINQMFCSSSYCQVGMCIIWVNTKNAVQFFFCHDDYLHKILCSWFFFLIVMAWPILYLIHWKIVMITSFYQKSDR